MINTNRVSGQNNSPYSSLMGMILSGKLSIGDCMPNVSDLANSLGMDAQEVQTALHEMTAHGLLETAPDGALVVSDYRVHGSKAFISALLAFQPQHILSLDMVISLVELLILLETDAARLAAINRSEAQLARLQEILKQSGDLEAEKLQRKVELEFEFHLAVAVCSGNLVYPTFINAFKEVYYRLTWHFFSRATSKVYQELLAYHRGLVQAIQRKQPRDAADMMRQMLEHEDVLMRELKKA